MAIKQRNKFKWLRKEPFKQKEYKAILNNHKNSAKLFFIKKLRKMLNYCQSETFWQRKKFVKLSKNLLRLLIFPVAVSTISISDCSVNTCSHLSRASFGIQNGRYLEPISYNKFQLSEVNQSASPCFTIFLLNWIPEAILSVNFPAKIINQMVLFRNSVTKVLLNLFVTLDPGADPIKKMSCWFRVL